MLDKDRDITAKALRYRRETWHIIPPVFYASATTLTKTRALLIGPIVAWTRVIIMLITLGDQRQFLALTGFQLKVES